jgi:hypothetical protein
MKRRGKRTRSAVSTDTTTISSDVETIDVDDEGGDVQSPKESKRWRRPVRHRGRRVDLRQAPTQRATLGRSTSSIGMATGTRSPIPRREFLY